MQIPPITRLPVEMRALLFDLDDTLYDRGATFYRWATAFVHAHIPAAEHTTALALLCALDTHGTASRVALFRSFQQSYPGLYEIEAMIAAYYQQFPQYMAGAHLRPLLDVISHLHIPIGIVTNGFVRQQQPKIAALGLATIASCIVISERFGAEKPAASLFLAAAASLQVPVEQILFIGDNPAVDICGASQVGMRTLWVQHDAAWPAGLPFCADASIKSIEELPALLAHYHRMLD